MKSEIAAVQFTRWSNLHVHNPYRGRPSVYLNEERVTEVGDEVFQKELRVIEARRGPFISPTTGKSYSVEDLLDIVEAMYADLS
jgi:hypothetical protein